MKPANQPAKTLRIALAFGLMSVLAYSSPAQTGEPQHDQLLNGLRVLLWSRPGDQTVVLKLRIHSGAIFDTADKAGTMALLGDLLFPDAATHEYITGEMGGRLEVNTGYDSIDVTLQGRSSEYDRIVDILRGALVTTPLTAAYLGKVREARIKKLSEGKPSAAEISDLAIANRLLGAFPYTQPIGGTIGSLKNIELADVMLARDRFMSPDNATLAIVGGVDQRRAMRALRQLLGGWRKSDRVVPATFRQPDLPDKRTLIMNSQGSSLAEVRLATRGVARSDKDFFTASLLALLARERWRTRIEAPGAGTFFVRADGHFLPELFVMGASVDQAAAARTLESAVAVLTSLITTPASDTELQMVKGSTFDITNQNLDKMVTAWLDIDTYKLQSLADQQQLRNAISPGDLQRVARRLFDGNSLTSVILGNEEQLKGMFAADKVQLASSSDPAKTKATGQVPTKKPDPNRKSPTPINIVPVIKNSGAATKPH